MKLDHLHGRQVENVDGEEITLEGGIVIHTGVEVPEAVNGMTLLSSESDDHTTTMKFGLTVNTPENGIQIQNETNVSMDSGNYGIAAPDAEELE
jgi:hypothetical protein